MSSQEQKLVLVKIIQADPHLAPQEKSELTNAVSNEDSWTKGLLGAGAGMAVAKFLKLSTNAQILLTMAGYGIGKYLLASHRKSDKLLSYDPKTKNYQINA